MTAGGDFMLMGFDDGISVPIFHECIAEDLKKNEGDGGTVPRQKKSDRAEERRGGVQEQDSHVRHSIGGGAALREVWVYHDCARQEQQAPAQTVGLSHGLYPDDLDGMREF